MKVAYVTVGFPLNSETFACSDIRVLRELGAEVTVHAMRGAPHDAAELLAARGLADLTVTYNGIMPSLRGTWFALRHIPLTLRTLAWVVRYTARTPFHLLRSLAVLPRCFDVAGAIGRDQPDVVHLFWGHYPALIGHLATSTAPHAVRSMFLGAYDLTRGYGPTVPTANAADVVWTHVRRNIEDIAALGVSTARVLVAYRGLDLRLFAEPHCPKVSGRMVSAGRLVRDKHVDDVLKAFQLVHAERRESSLVIFGEGPDRWRLARLARRFGIGDAVTFAGHVPQTVVRDELQRSQAFITLSREPGDRLANIVKEAMVSRCVPVVSLTPGIDELVIDGRTGFVVEQGDTRAAADRLIALITDSVKASHMAALGARRVREHFDARRSMARYLGCWEQIAAAKQAALSNQPLPAA